MIQEIFKGNTPSSSPISSSTNSNSENVRCPRCDSPNTKFCYYNNYNLTQPRHFCKSCRRYWTKGGALRNVPIGGSCRKNKNNNSSSITTTKSSSVAKLKLASLPFEIIGKAGSFGGYEQEIVTNSTNPSIFGYIQNHHHLLSLLRGNQYLKSSFGYNKKEEKDVFGCGGILDGKSQGIISYNQHGHQDESSRGLEEIYQRLKASTSSRGYDFEPSSLSMVLDSTPIAAGGGEVGLWNPTISTWSDHLPTTNGAFL